MKFSDHYVSASDCDGTIFSFLKSRQIRGEYQEKYNKFDWLPVYEVLAEMPDSPSKKKILKSIQEVRRNLESKDKDLTELTKTLQTTLNVLEKLDMKCQELTEPKPKPSTEPAV